jgi:hypothetical protein
MPERHVHVSRGWDLIRNKLQLTPIENRHLEQCERCHQWLTRFTEMAKRSGFEIAYTIPILDKRNGTTG